MMNCRTCGCFMTFPDRHRCPPRFEVVEADTASPADDVDRWEHAAIIFAHDAEAAVEKWADQHDCEGDYTIISGTPAKVDVRAADGETTRWEVSGEAVPSYSAAQVDA